MERELFRLLAKSGGLGTKRTSKISDRKYRKSRMLTQEGSHISSKPILNLRPQPKPVGKNQKKYQI